MPKVPKLIRYSLGEKITSLFLEIIELIILAGYSEQRIKLQILQKASIKLDLLKYFLQTAFELNALNENKLSALTIPLADAGRQLGGWQKHLHKQTPPG